MKVKYEIETRYIGGGNHGDGFYHTELVEYVTALFGILSVSESLGYWNSKDKAELEKNIAQIKAEMPTLIEKHDKSVNFAETYKVDL